MWYNRRSMSSLATTTTCLLLIRHAESLSNRHGPAIGPDSGLTALGWEQARQLADWLAANEPLDVIVCSTLLCARQTAEIVSQRLDIPLFVQDGLEEAEAPYWEELPTFAETKGLADAPWWPTAETAPNYTAFRERVVPALRAVLDQHWQKRIGVISHGGTMSTLLRALIGGHHVNIYQDNTAIHKLVWGERSRWTLVYANRSEHLIPCDPTPTTNAASSTATSSAVSTWPERASLAVAPRSLHLLSSSQIDALLRRLQPQPDEAALDVMAGSGAFALRLAPLVARLVAVDPSPHMLEQIEMARLQANIINLQVRWAIADRLPFADESFDVVVCALGLHHVADAAVALHEMARVCRRRGRILLYEIVGDADPVKRATQDVIERRRDPTHQALATADLLRTAAIACDLEIAYEEEKEVEQRLGDWLALANADEATAEAVTNMLDAAAEGDAAGLRVHRERDGDLSFRQRRLTLLLRKP